MQYPCRDSRDVVAICDCETKKGEYNDLYEMRQGIYIN
jgi:hypothetical protein